MSDGTSAVDHLQTLFDSRASDNSIKEEEPEEEIDESTLFDDIFDQGRFAAEGSRSPSPPLDDNLNNREQGMYGGGSINQTDFSRFAKIPIGTFWKSQRKGSKGGGVSKRKDLQRAIKKSSDFKILDSTLMENIPKPSKKSSKGSLRSSSSSNAFMFSPVMFAEDASKLQFSASGSGIDHFPPSTPLDFLPPSSLPPPFLLP